MLNHHSQHSDTNSASGLTMSRALTGLAIGAGVIGVSIMLAPHLLPVLGVTSAELAQEAADIIHINPTGLAGIINNTMRMIPVIGPSIASGSLWTAAASAITGAGGVLLGQFIEGKEDDRKRLKWGSVIKYGALMTSALISLPAILTALSTGIIYAGLALSEAGIISNAASNSIMRFVAKTLGSVGGDYAHNIFGLSGVSAMLPHLLCCSAPVAPAAISYLRSSASGHATYSDGSVSAHLCLENKVEAGKPCYGTITLKHTGGGTIGQNDLNVVHTQKMHLMIADTSFKDYHHIHPRPTDEEGVLAFSFTPQSSNDYSAWADFTLLDGQNHKVKMDIPSITGRSIPPTIRANSSIEKKGLRFDWKSEPLRKGQTSVVEVTVSDADGNPVADLQPVMGAFAHLVGFSADSNQLLHSHPLGPEISDEGARGGPSLRFHVEPHTSGATQFYLQVKHKGEDIYAPFGQHIKTPSLATQRVSMPQQGAHHYAGI